MGRSRSAYVPRGTGRTCVCYGCRPLPQIAVVIKRAAAFLGLAGLGVGLYLWLVQDADAPRSRRKREGGQPVRVLVVAEHAAVPRITGHGLVEAQRSWQGVSQVGGRVVEVDERVQVGRIVREGTVLFKIDPEDLELEKSKSKSNVKAARAQLAELGAREQSAKASLAVEKKVLELARNELERTRALHESGALALIELETAQRAVLTAEKAVVSYENTLAELPASRRVLQAQIEQLEAGVEGADLQLSRTQVVAPFTMQIREVTATIGQAVSSGAVLVVGDGVQAMEVTAKLPVGAIDPLLPARRSAAADPAAVDPALGGTDAVAADGVGAAVGAAAAPAGGRWLERITAALDVTVSLETPTVRARWPAKFSRFAGIDPASRTLGVVVTVERPPPGVEQRVRLSPGLHVEVELRGQPQPGCLAVPTEALHGTTVYVVDADDRLARREVELSWAQEDYACVAAGIIAGERVVTTRLTPAVEGMLLAPTVDEFTARRVSDLVGGARSES
jgi:multidrug efflux pump subunit AcrA (membrane-fusion protein)